jgi:hypothetical protein
MHDDVVTEGGAPFEAGHQRSVLLSFIGPKKSNKHAGGEVFCDLFQEDSAETALSS